MSVFDNDSDLDPQFNINNGPNLANDGLVTAPGSLQSQKVTTSIAVAGITGKRPTEAPVYAEKLAVIERRKAKLLDMKDVEETIIAGGAMSQESVSYVDENFSFFSKSGRSKNEFSKQPTKTNYAYVVNWMSSALRTEQAVVDKLSSELSVELETERADMENWFTTALGNYVAMLEGNREAIRQTLENKESKILSIQGRDTNNQLTATTINILTDPVPSSDDYRAYWNALLTRPEMTGATSLKELDVLRAMLLDRSNEAVVFFMRPDDLSPEFTVKGLMELSGVDIGRESISLADMMSVASRVSRNRFLEITGKHFVATGNTDGLQDSIAVRNFLLSLADLMASLTIIVPVILSVTSYVE